MEVMLRDYSIFSLIIALIIMAMVNKGRNVQTGTYRTAC